MEPAQQQFQLRDVKRRRRAAAEVNRRWTKAARPAAALSSSRKIASQNRVVCERSSKSL